MNHDDIPTEPLEAGTSVVRRHRGRVAAASGLTVVVVAGVAVGLTVAGHGSSAAVHPPSATPAAATQPAAPLSTAPVSTAPAHTVAPAAAASTTAAATGAPPAGVPDDFAEVTSAGVQVVSAQTGAVVRTVVPAAVLGGRTFADVGPSGRYVYFTAIDGPARVPLGGGAVQQLASPPGSGIVDAIDADASDTRFEEQLDYADDSAPVRVVATTLGSTAVTQLGLGFATGWDRTGTTAYVTTVRSTAGTAQQVGTPTVTITGVDAADPAHHGFVDSRVSASPGDDGACGMASTATAAGPDGLVGWATGGCSTATAGRLTYAFRTVLAGGRSLSLVSATLPRDDWGFVARSMQYTPAGTAVLTLTHQDCGAGTTGTSGVAIAVSRGTGGVAADLPGRGC